MLLDGLARRGEILASSEVVRFELLTGARDHELGDLETFFSALDWITVDENVSRVAGSLARRFRRSHRGIDDADYLIAASALVSEAELLTTNVRHFPMFPALSAPY